MKRTLLIAACSLCLGGLHAQTTPKWSAVVENAVTAQDELNLGAPTAVDNAGNVYATGAFTQGFAIGSAWFEPIAKSAYLAKYDNNGNALWAVSLAGAATITAIATDETNNVYIAGTLADAVVVGSTDGNNRTINGKGGELEYQVSSFIAAYTAEGVLKATKVIWSVADAEIEASLIYFPNTGYPYANINHLEAADGKVYASVTYTGDLAFDEVVWEGAYVNIFGFMYDDLASNGIFAVDAESLADATSVVRVGNTTEILSDVQMGPESFGFTIDGSDVYFCFVGLGDMTVSAGTAGSSSVNFAFDGAGTNEHGYVVGSIKEGALQTKVYNNTPHDNIASYDVIGNVQVDDENLYVGGTFHQALAFDNTVTHVGGCDLYAVALDKTTLETAWVCTSGLDEGNGDALHFYEDFDGMVLSDATVTLYGHSVKSESGESSVAANLEYSCSAEGVVAGSPEGTSNIVSGVALRGTTLAILTVDATELSTTLSSYDMQAGGDGVKSISALAAQRVGNTFYFAEPTDVAVYDLQGRKLIGENAATMVNIDGLNTGIYILTNGEANLKVLKAKP